jgi:hypothetical protein
MSEHQAVPHVHELIFSTGGVIPVALTCKQADDLAENLQRQVTALKAELAVVKKALDLSCDDEYRSERYDADWLLGEAECQIAAAQTGGAA